MRPLTALAPLALTGALLSGCAAQSSSDNAKTYSGDQKAVATVVDDLSKATRDRNGKTVCDSLLTPERVASLNQGNNTCADVVKSQLDDADVYKLDVKSIKVAGNTATAVVDSDFNGNTQRRTLAFRKVGSTWRIASMQ